MNTLAMLVSSLAGSLRKEGFCDGKLGNQHLFPPVLTQDVVLQGRWRAASLEGRTHIDLSSKQFSGRFFANFPNKS